MWGGGGGGSMLLGWVPFFLFTLPVHYLLVCYIHVCSCTFYTYNAGGDIGGRGGGTPSFHSGGADPPHLVAQIAVYTLPHMCIVKILTTQEPFIIHTSSPHTCTCNSQSTTGTCRYMYLMHNTVCYTCTVSSTLVVMETCHIQL